MSLKADLRRFQSRWWVFCFCSFEQVCVLTFFVYGGFGLSSSSVQLPHLVVLRGHSMALEYYILLLALATIGGSLIITATQANKYKSGLLILAGLPVSLALVSTLMSKLSLFRPCFDQLFGFFKTSSFFF